MSLILDALNKADQERGEQREVPNLRAVHDSPYPRPQQGLFKRWRVEIGFVVLLIVAYLAYQFFSSTQQSQQEPQSASTGRRAGAN